MSRWPDRTVYERFWFHVSTEETSRGCWEWQGALTTGGYGLFSHGLPTRRAHRAAWMLMFGSVPRGIDVCHRCDNRLCCRPSHMFLGTRKDNMQDAKAKGRTRPGPRMPGESHPEAKLTWDAVTEIRAAKGVSHYELARRYGVSRPLIGYVLNDKSWHEADRPA